MFKWVHDLFSGKDTTASHLPCLSEATLVLILPPALDNPRSVQSLALKLGFSGKQVRVLHGPAEVTRGRAEALLCRMDGENGTRLLDSPFRFGSDLQNGEKYGYIIVGPGA